MMDAQKRSSLGLGVVLIVLGAIFLLNQFIPGFGLVLSWPWIVIGVGAALLVVGLLVGAPDMAVPAFIVAGIGGIYTTRTRPGIGPVGLMPGP